MQIVQLNTKALFLSELLFQNSEIGEEITASLVFKSKLIWVDAP